jgi:hypothetical protein
MNLSVDKTKELYSKLITTLEMLDKCNLLTDGTDTKLPFPLTDISFNIIIIIVSVIVMLFVIYELNPMKKIKEIREYTIKRTQLANGIHVDLTDLYCDDMDIEMVTSLKVIGLIIFIVMTILYCVKLVNSSDNYVSGLYNSRYYDEGRTVK